MSAQYLDFSTVEEMLDSVYAEQNGKCILEKYSQPYDKYSLHRMFSVTKSYCSLAILALAAEGRLSLEDTIIDYFPEYVKGPVHPWLKEMTVSHMLTMRTCHAKTTFHLKMESNWVESFFTTIPNHRPGQIFQYDTSSSHTLAALVKKLTGKGVLEYLREVFLGKAGFSEEAYILKDPFGMELGGSGLMARTSDLVCTARVLMRLIEGDEDGGRNLEQSDEKFSFHEYITEKYPVSFWIKYSGLVKEALSFQTPTRHFGQTVDERQGYGMHFWIVRDGGAAMYGLGGQYVILYPKHHLFVVTTADTQNIKGGSQSILDCVNRYVKSLKCDSEGEERETDLCGADICLSLENIPRTEILKKWLGCYEILQPGAIFREIKLEMQMLRIYRKLGDRLIEIRIPFSLAGKMAGEGGNLGEECRMIYTRAVALPGNHLYLEIKNCDISIGVLQIMIHFDKGGYVCVYMRTAGMEGMEEFNGFFDGVMK